jgi:hypothetical protein
MGLLNLFRRFTGLDISSAQDRPLATLCYRIAYSIVPVATEKDPQKIIQLWNTSPPSAGAFFYGAACQLFDHRPDRDLVKEFRCHQVKLDGTRDCYVLEYPKPTPINLTAEELIKMAQKSRDRIPVLAPHFSALIHEPGREQIDCFVLGQSFHGGTTLRGVDAESNSNLGPGPDNPTLDAFMDALRG